MNLCNSRIDGLDIFIDVLTKFIKFSLQFSEETGYCDNIQQMTGARDTYDGWTEIKPSADFVDYYKNADGSDFKWSEVDGLQDWDLLTPKQREIFFCRDGLESMSSHMALTKSKR